MKESVTPKQLSQAIAVSESSLKRWCDKGIIPAVYTAGGHRRIPVSGALNFLREAGHDIRHPEILGLPLATTGGADRKIAEEKSRLIEAMVAGNEEVCVEIVFNLFLANHSLSAICDDVLVPAFHDIGDLWNCGDVDIYQERRCCELCHRVMHELRRALPELPPEAPIAVGGTLDGDPYTLASSMAELVLRDSGWRANSLGNMLPFASLAQAMCDTRAELLWVSVSTIRDSERFFSEFQQLSELALNRGVALIVGGKALTEDIRMQMKFTAHCDNFMHLETFSKQTLELLRKGA